MPKQKRHISSPPKVLSATIEGLSAELVEVEADISRGLIRFYIVGLPDAAVQEARERVRSSIKNSGFDFPIGTITINLAPADTRKEGPRFDLPIAIALLARRGHIDTAKLDNTMLYVGELSLDGATRPVRGILSIALLAKKKKIKYVCVPAANAAEAALVPGITIMPVQSLRQLVSHINGSDSISPYKKEKPSSPPAAHNSPHDFSYIRGQDHAKRALEIAAAGGHNVLMTGPPGSGKTLLARSMVTVLPPMTVDESLVVTQVYSVAGLVANDAPLICQRPFRTPHHSTSAVALVGGGSTPRPGEITLAHRGVLFLDELPEFPRGVLESLRQPLEDGLVTVSRAAGSVQFPARFTLIAARNPCPCGYQGCDDRACTCTPYQIARYQKRISGPLLDRIDMHITVPKISYEKLSSTTPGESSTEVKQRVATARHIQTQRFQKTTAANNAELSLRQLERWCSLDMPAKKLLKQAVNQFALSPRAYHRVIKVARTIADLAGEENIADKHVAESLQYRPFQE